MHWGDKRSCPGTVVTGETHAVAPQGSRMLVMQLLHQHHLVGQPAPLSHTSRARDVQCAPQRWRVPWIAPAG